LLNTLDQQSVPTDSCPRLPRITVAVCTYNRAGLLEECLESLVNQTADANTFEVIVVNNGSTDQTQQVAQQFTRQHSTFHVVIENKPGLSHARNLAFRNARSNWISYIDDDAKAFPNFVERALQTIAIHGFDCFGGIYVPWYKFGRPKWYRDQWASNQAGKPAQVEILQHDFASGGVMVIRKNVLEQLHGFSLRLGMIGGKTAYGEETQLQVAMRNSGMTIGFDPQLRVEHLVSKEKLTMRWFFKSAFAAGRDSWNAFGARASWWKLIRQILSLPGTFFWKSAKTTCRLFNKDYYLQTWLVDTLRPCAYRIGRICGCWQEIDHKIFSTSLADKMDDTTRKAKYHDQQLG